MHASMSFRSFKILLLVQEELWAAVEAELLDAAGEVYIAGEDAEALNGAYVAKVDDYLVWQWLHVLAPCWNMWAYLNSGIAAIVFYVNMLNVIRSFV